MAQGLLPASFLEDSTHPNCEFLAEEVNILLNLARQR